MKLVEINSYNIGSTGNIMINITKLAERKGHKTYIFVPKERVNLRKKLPNQSYIGSFLTRHFHLIFGYLTGLNGFFSIIPTLLLIRKLKKIKPDVIHLHNLHNCYINLPIMFNFLSNFKGKVFWTLHDCWSITGHCPHFILSGCDKWKRGCHDCQNYSKYPSTLYDNAEFMWRQKKKWFNSVDNLTIITPSRWLASLVKLSYLQVSDVHVINNGIDLDIFKPRESFFKGEYGIENSKYVVLGVSMGWSYEKGIDIFINLANSLDDKYVIVLVGTDSKTDEMLPNNIISIHRTDNAEQLAEIYSSADVFINTTREDNFPTVNIEALACGAPVITHDVGGSGEMIDEKTGIVISQNEIGNVDCLMKAVKDICENKTISRDNCVRKANNYDRWDKYEEYMKLMTQEYLKKDN